MGKDAKGKGKGKGKTRAKKVKGGKCAVEKQDVKESTDSLRNTFIAERSSFGKVSFSSSLPPDSNEESCSQPALTLTLIFNLLAPRIFERSGSSADAEIVEGVWPNQGPLSLSARFFFSLLDNMELFLSSLGRFFSFSLPKAFFLLLIFP